MFENFEPGKTEKAKCPHKNKNSTLPKTMPQAAGRNSRDMAILSSLQKSGVKQVHNTKWNQRNLKLC